MISILVFLQRASVFGKQLTLCCRGDNIKLFIASHHSDILRLWDSVFFPGGICKIIQEMYYSYLYAYIGTSYKYLIQTHLKIVENPF